MSRSLADILTPLVGKSIHHVNNSQHLVEDLGEIIVEEDEMLVSHDVVSLFINTPICETLYIIKDRLIKDGDLKNRTRLEVDDIMQLLKFALATTYFSFRGNLYKQTLGQPWILQPVLLHLTFSWNG